jgi:uncharacterized lipoprotein YajG
MKTKILFCAIALLLILGCSTAKKPVKIPDFVDNISVQRVPAAEVTINRVKADEQYDFYIALLDDAGEAAKLYVVKGFREQATAQFYGELNSVIINDEGEALYALVVDRDIEYRLRSADD